jgi:hypothetical protein
MSSSFDTKVIELRMGLKIVSNLIHKRPTLMYQTDFKESSSNKLVSYLGP